MCCGDRTATPELVRYARALLAGVRMRGRSAPSHPDEPRTSAAVEWDAADATERFLDSRARACDLTETGRPRREIDRELVRRCYVPAATAVVVVVAVIAATDSHLIS